MLENPPNLYLPGENFPLKKNQNVTTRGRINDHEQRNRSPPYIPNSTISNNLEKDFLKRETFIVEIEL